MKALKTLIWALLPFVLFITLGVVLIVEKSIALGICFLIIPIVIVTVAIIYNKKYPKQNSSVHHQTKQSVHVNNDKNFKEDEIDDLEFDEIMDMLDEDDL